jgi:hypothetical protein
MAPVVDAWCNWAPSWFFRQARPPLRLLIQGVAQALCRALLPAAPALVPALGAWSQHLNFSRFESPPFPYAIL